MKLHAERIEGTNAISRHGPDGVIVNGVEHRSSVVVPWKGMVQAWPAARFGYGFRSCTTWYAALAGFGVPKRAFTA